MQQKWTINSVLLHWGITENHPLEKSAKKYIYEELTQTYIEIFTNDRNGIIQILSSDESNLPLGIADMTWNAVESLCDEYPVPNSDVPHIALAASQILKSLAEIINKTSSYQVHELVLGEAFQIISERLADRYDINLEQSNHTL